MRRDITDINNVRWLLRNVQVRNSDHKDIEEVLAVLHTQRKHLQKGA